MCQSSAVSRRDRRKVDPGYAVGLFLLLSAGFEGWFALVFPFWLLALTGILLVRARRLPSELRLPATVPSPLAPQQPLDRGTDR